VAVFHKEAPDDADATFVATKDLLDRILLGETNVKQVLENGELKIDGDQAGAISSSAISTRPARSRSNSWSARSG
jgi:putative sterol carrier protein